MEFIGTYQVAASRERVWKLMNDPVVVQKCVPGCEELTDEGAGVFKAKLLFKFGPITARFAGKMLVSDQVQPEAYTITTKRKGVAIGVTKVQFTECDGVTTISYHAEAKIGGKFTWLGGSVISTVSEKLANQFLANFAEIAQQPE